MTAVVALVAVIAVIAVIAFLIAKVWNRRPGEPDQDGADILPYLILALAVGVAGFTFARLARVALTWSQLAGEPESEIAAALAGLVVSAPIAYLLWRRQTQRRAAHPRSPGWPVYLSVIEIVFLTAFFVAVGQVANGIAGLADPSPWTDLIVYGGIVAFHWWAGLQTPPQGEASELPRLIGSGVALIALAIGMQGVLNWLLDELYAVTFGNVADQFVDSMSTGERLAGPLGLLVAAAPIWAWRWLTAWKGEPSPLRHLYLGAVAVTGLVTALGAGIVIVSSVVSYWLATTEARLHFAGLPEQLSALIVGYALWAHHRRRMGTERTGAIRGYEYAMAAIGLGALVGAGTALVALVWETPLAGDPSQSGLIGIGLTVLVAGGIWLYFWRHVQKFKLEERRSPQRRLYLVGMAVILGLTTAGALIALLVIAFQATLAEGDLSSLPVPVTLTVLAGIATWHLFRMMHFDGPADSQIAGSPFAVTVICSHPGRLATLFPKEATMRVVYRSDDAGVVDDEMAAQIVSAVDGHTSIVWVDEDGFRVAPARST